VAVDVDIGAFVFRGGYCTVTEVEEEEGEATAALVATVPEEPPKFALAVTTKLGVTSTPFTRTTSPSILVTFTSTMLVPKPLEFSKKL
jgi:hypothetical protein